MVPVQSKFLLRPGRRGPRLAGPAGPGVRTGRSSIFSILKEQGRDIVDPSIGEPDFDTPEHVCETAIDAIRNGATKYTSTDGTTALKRAVQTKLARDNGLDYGIDQIVIDSGVMPLLYHAVQQAGGFQFARQSDRRGLFSR